MKAKTLESMFTDHRRYLLWLGVKICGCPLTTEDAIQDIFLKLCKDSISFDHVNNLKGYLIVSLRRELFTICSRNETRQRLIAKATFDKQIPEQADLQTAFKISRLQLLRLIKTLPKRQQQAIQLLLDDLLDYTAASKLLGMSEGSYRALVKDARHNMRDKLARLEMLKTAAQ